MLQFVDFIRVTRNAEVSSYCDYDEEGNLVPCLEHFYRSTVEIHVNGNIIAMFTNIEQIDIEHTFCGGIAFDNVPNSYIIKCYKVIEFNGRNWGFFEFRDTNETVEEAELAKKLAMLEKMRGRM